MQGYKIYFNTVTKQWDYELTPSEIGALPGYMSGEWWVHTIDQAKGDVDTLNKNRVKKLRSDINNTVDKCLAHEVRICKKCNKPFMLDFGEWNWFHSKGLKNPKKCYRCRTHSSRKYLKS